MEYNYLEMQVTPIIPKAVADEQILVYVPIGQTGLAGILRPSPADFSVSSLGEMRIITSNTMDKASKEYVSAGYVRAGVIYDALAERDKKIENLDSTKQNAKDNELKTESKQIVDAINELNGKIGDAENGLTKRVGDLESSVSTLKTTVGDANSGLVKKVNTNASNISANSEAIGKLKSSLDNTNTNLSEVSGKVTSLDTNKQDKEISIVGLRATTVNDALKELSDEKADAKSVNSSLEKLEGEIKTNSDAIATNKTSIDENSKAINNLEQAAYGGETPIGSYDAGATLPSQDELTAFVQEKVSRAPKLGDVVLFTQIVTGDTDKSYKFMYTASGWSNYVIPTVEAASNTDKGIIQGTLNDASGNIQVSIVAGKVSDILVKDGASFKSVKALFDGLATSLANTNTTIADNKALADQGIVEAKAAAAAVIKKLNNVTFTFVTDSDTTMSKFPCKYTAEIEGVTISNVVDVYFSALQIPLEIFSSYVQVEAGKVSIFATTKVDYPVSLTVPTVRIS